MHLADAFIQSDLQLHSGYTFLISILGIEPTTFCAADAMLYRWTVIKTYTDNQYYFNLSLLCKCGPCSYRSSKNTLGRKYFEYTASIREIWTSNHTQTTLKQTKATSLNRRLYVSHMTAAHLLLSRRKSQTYTHHLGWLSRIDGLNIKHVS